MAKLFMLLKLFCCVSLVGLSVASAQTQPPSGILPVSSFTADNLFRSTPADEVAPSPAVLQREKTTFRKPALWKVSIATLAVANTMDIASSWGKRELNPALAAPSTKFGASSAGLKAGIVGLVIGVEFIATRHRPSPALFKALSILNFCDAGVVAGVAAHNFTVPAYSH
jgi:hypothetical protein